MHIAVLGLGEAGSHFANDLAALGARVTGWDPAPKRALDGRVMLANSNAAAAQGADVILSVNLSAASEGIAAEVLEVLTPRQVYVEMNTSSPQQKTMVYHILQPSGVQFVDLAIMAPVPPKGIHTPFLASGPGAFLLQQKFLALGITVQVLGETVGDASMRKLLRSIVYKGVAAVICEALEAGRAFGLENYIRQQVSSVIGGNDLLIDRFEQGSYEHAERRIHEMEAVVHMLQEKGMEPLMSAAAKDNLLKIQQKKEKTLFQ